MLCRSLSASCASGATPIEALHVVLNDFAECLMRIFRTEEQTLARSACPRLGQHKAEHDALCERLTDLLFQATQHGPDRAAWIQVAVQWSNHHLHGTDLRDRAYLQQR